MNIRTRVLSVVVAATAGAGFFLSAVGAPATAAPGTPAPTPDSACQALGGQLDDYGYGSWDCSYSPRAGAPLYDPSLVAVCGTTPSAHIFDNGLVVATIDFYCPPVLIN